MSELTTVLILFKFPFKSSFAKAKKNLIIGFNSNQLSERGTEIALYDYAFYNQKILNNKSIIFYQKNHPANNENVVKKFEKEFEVHGYSSFDEINGYNLDYF